MAGHNKWSKIKRLKGANDAKRGKVFSRYAREITLAAREGGGSLEMNYRLRSLVQSARAQNMPNDNIERAIQKGTGELEGDALEEVIYEGYGPGGVAVMLEVATDNRNRSAADIRSMFSKNGGNLGANGSVAFMFERRGQISTESVSSTEDEMLEIVLDTGADEMVADDEGVFLIYTAPDQLYAVAEALREKEVPLADQRLVFIPQNSTRVEDPAVAAQLMRLLDVLEDYDDTLNVYSNMEIDDEVMQAASA